jgi:BTB/POZ domain-containing protein KCTD9
MRRTLEQSWAFLEAMGANMPRLPDGSPHVSTRMPSYDDASPTNITFFRTGWQDTDLSDLTLSRTYFARSKFERVSFMNTILFESRMCWNDFIDCDFSNADLRHCDMRASLFRGCMFRNADLSEADLRRSMFDACIFEGAKLKDSVGHKRSAAEDLVQLLTKSQRDEMRWFHDLGEQPSGG